MNEDLDELENVIQTRKAQEAAVSVQTPVVPAIPFENTAEKRQSQVGDKAGELVENAFNQAVIHTVATDANVQNELLDSAGKVVRNKTSEIRERAEQAEKEAYFNNRKGACECFGYSETTTPKWAANIMNLWHNGATLIWIILGFFTFAPITFVAKKIVVIFKKSWLAFLIAIVIYLIIVVGIPLLTRYLNLNT